MGASVLEDYAIVIGISYPSATFRGLLGTRRDAAAFIQWLRSSSGGNVPVKNIKEVISPARPQSSWRNAKPIQEQIDDALLEIGVGGSNKPIGRRLYFYFTGHGFGRQADEVCMLMAHATSQHYNRNIGLREYRNLFQNTFYFEEVVFILDCCRDPVPPGSGAVPRSATLTPLADDPVPRVSDLVVLAAAHGKKAHETIDPKTRERRGLFTLALLDVLSSKVSGGTNGQLTASTLRDYLEARMQAIGAAAGGTGVSQQPTIEIRDNLNTKLVLMTIPGTVVPVRIIAPPGANGDLVVFEGTETEIARRSAIEVTPDKDHWLVDLHPTKSYSVRHEKADGTERDAVIIWAEVGANSKDGNYEFVFPR